METFQITLSFDIPDLDKYGGGIRATPCPEEYLASLKVSDGSISLEIPYETSTYLGHKFFLWMRVSQKKNLGQYLLVSGVEAIPRIAGFDFSQSKMLRANNSGWVGTKSILSFELDWLRTTWEPQEEYSNESEVYLNRAGFRLTSEFYSVMFYDHFDDEFDIKRFSDKWYSTRMCSFQPKHHYVFGDNKESTEINITKEPFIEIKDYHCEEAELIADVKMICSLATFFYHEPIEYIFLRLRFPEYTVTIKQLPSEYLKTKKGGFLYVDYPKRVEHFLGEANLAFFYADPDVAHHIIEKFVLSAELRGTSKFLLLYNLLEIIRAKGSPQKSRATRHPLRISKKEFQTKWKKAESIILEAFEPDSREELQNKLTNFRGHLAKRSINNPLQELFTHYGLSTESFPISLKDLTRLRSDIIHGNLSMASDTEYVDKANHLLYRIVAILILRLLGISETKLTIDPRFK